LIKLFGDYAKKLFLHLANSFDMNYSWSDNRTEFYQGKGSDGLENRILSFEELIAPLSHKKVMVVVECLSIDGCEQPEIMSELMDVLKLGFGSGYDDWEDFLDYGFVVIEGAPTAENISEACLLIDLLRQQKYQSLIQADFFVDGFLRASSWAENADEGLVAEVKQKQIKSVVIRFPVEKTKQRSDTEAKN
jgi:hypothetical protein